MFTKTYMCILYVGLIVLLTICIMNSMHRRVENFQQVSLSNNNDMAKYQQIYMTDNKMDINNDVYSLENISNIKETGVAINSGGIGNNSKSVLYTNKDDGRNYNSMVQDLVVNYIDPNIEKNESCSPPGLCDIQEIKRKYTCGCGNNAGECFDKNKSMSTVAEAGSDIIEGSEDIIVGSEDIIEGYSNYSKSDLNGVFFTDYGGGERYIPEGDCGAGFQKNKYGLCEKLCHNCSTYTTDHKDGLMKIKMDKKLNIGCGECTSCGGCSNCNSSCNCSNDNGCKSCGRCSRCNNCENKKLNKYRHFNDFINY